MDSDSFTVRELNHNIETQSQSDCEINHRYKLISLGFDMVWYGRQARGRHKSTYSKNKKNVDRAGSEPRIKSLCADRKMFVKNITDRIISYFFEYGNSLNAIKFQYYSTLVVAKYAPWCYNGYIQNRHRHANTIGVINMDGFTLTGNQIQKARLLTLYRVMELEGKIKGFKMTSRSRSALAITKSKFGWKGNRATIMANLKNVIDDMPDTP